MKETTQTANGTLYARLCSVTGRGMWEGFVFGDGEKYAIDQESAEKIAKDYGYRDWAECYEDEAGYWTAWEDEEDAQYIERHGIIYEL
jgi:hypothetical protein